MRSLRSFSSHKLRVFKEKFKETQVVCLYLMENPRKKEFVDSEFARGRVSKFYWLVALGSRAGVLVSLLYELRFFLIVDSSLP